MQVSNNQAILVGRGSFGSLRIVYSTLCPILDLLIPNDVTTHSPPYGYKLGKRGQRSPSQCIRKPSVKERFIIKKLTLHNVRKKGAEFKSWPTQKGDILFEEGRAHK